MNDRPLNWKRHTDTHSYEATPAAGSHPTRHYPCTRRENWQCFQGKSRNFLITEALRALRQGPRSLGTTSSCRILPEVWAEGIPSTLPCMEHKSAQRGFQATGYTHRRPGAAKGGKINCTAEINSGFHHSKGLWRTSLWLWLLAVHPLFPPFSRPILL